MGCMVFGEEDWHAYMRRGMRKHTWDWGEDGIVDVWGEYIYRECMAVGGREAEGRGCIDPSAEFQG